MNTHIIYFYGEIRRYFLDTISYLELNTSPHCQMDLIKSFPSRKHAYKFDPLKPHFYIANWGLQGYTLFFLFPLKKHTGYALEPPRRGGSNEYHNLCFDQKYENY